MILKDFHAQVKGLLYTSWNSSEYKIIFKQGWDMPANIVSVLSSKTIAFWGLSPQKKRMFFLNFCLLGFARGLIMICSYRRIAPYLGHNCRMLQASTLPYLMQYQRILHIKRSIALASRYTPWTSTCLTQAMIAVFWCKRERIPYMLYVGFAKQREKPLGREAHAWVTAGPVLVSGGDGFKTHHVVYSYSNQCEEIV